MLSWSQDLTTSVLPRPCWVLRQDHGLYESSSRCLLYCSNVVMCANDTPCHTDLGAWELSRIWQPGRDFSLKKAVYISQPACIIPLYPPTPTYLHKHILGFCQEYCWQMIRLLFFFFLNSFHWHIWLKASLWSWIPAGGYHFLCSHRFLRCQWYNMSSSTANNGPEGSGWPDKRVPLATALGTY